jgi:2-polyprenyl-3-methyl-5-hydroxy-6-metoxy-1,4-benzoquinol methylase
MPDFTQRASGSEIMDDLRVSGSDLHRALRELESINYLLGGNYVTLNAVMQLVEKKQTLNEIHIADLGCGSGDLLKLIRRLLDKKKVNASLTGIDANQNVIRYAIAQTPPACRIHYETLDIFSEEFAEKRFDIVAGTLFFHHFSTPQLVKFFRQLKAPGSLLMIFTDIGCHITR